MKSSQSSMNCSTFRSSAPKKMTYDSVQSTVMNLSQVNAIKSKLKKRHFNNIIIIVQIIFI